MFYNLSRKVLVNEGSLISVIIMATFILILYSLIKQKIDNKKLAEKYDKLLEFIKQYEIEIEEQKTLRHETKNQLLTIKTRILDKADSEVTVKYIDGILDEYHAYDKEKYTKLQYLPANGLKGLFYYKAMEAEEKGILLSINVAKKVEDSFIKDISVNDFKQLGRLVGVYLDNAIEASQASKDKKMGMEVYMRGEDVEIIITNTFDGEIDTESIGNVKYTTKGKNHGYGLMLAKRILQENKRFVASTNIRNNIYEQKLLIKKSIN